MIVKREYDKKIWGWRQIGGNGNVAIHEYDKNETDRKYDKRNNAWLELMRKNNDKCNFFPKAPALSLRKVRVSSIDLRIAKFFQIKKSSYYYSSNWSTTIIK